MSSDDDVYRLHREGLSIRAIAKELGLSRSMVHRRIAAVGDDDEPVGLGDDGGYRPTPPFRFAGMEPCGPDGRLGERICDGNRRLVSLADIHLACLPDGSIDGYDWYAIWNLIEKQIEATGWVRVGVEDGPGGWWHWERADAAPMTPVGL